jgi:hypothetical protein
MTDVSPTDHAFGLVDSAPPQARLTRRIPPRNGVRAWNPPEVCTKLGESAARRARIGAAARGNFLSGGAEEPGAPRRRVVIGTMGMGRGIVGRARISGCHDERCAICWARIPLTAAAPPTGGGAPPRDVSAGAERPWQPRRCRRDRATSGSAVRALDGLASSIGAATACSIRACDVHCRHEVDRLRPRPKINALPDAIIGPPTMPSQVSE